MIEEKLKYGVNIETMLKETWSFGICLSRSEKEIYLYINLFKWSISIGRFYEYEISS